MSVSVLSSNLLIHQALLSNNGALNFLEDTHYRSLMPPLYQIGNNLIVASFEYMKTLPAFYAVQQAVKRNDLEFGGAVIESTSGSMGVGLAKAWSNLADPNTGKKDNKTYLVGSPRGVDDYMVNELRMLNAETHIVTTADTNNFQLNRLRYLAQLKNELLQEGKKSIYWPEQYDNIDLQQSYYTLADYATEIVRQTFDKDVDTFVCSVGTGAAFSGTSIRLKEINPSLTTACVDFQGSNILGKDSLPDTFTIGAGGFMKCNNTNYALMDDCHYVDQNQAVYQQLQMLKQGVSMGYSSGATFQVAKWYAQENPDKIVFMIAPDRIDRYRTNLLTQEMLQNKKINPNPLDEPKAIVDPNEVLDAYRDQSGQISRPVSGYGWQMICKPSEQLISKWQQEQQVDRETRVRTFAEGQSGASIPHIVHTVAGEKKFIS